jgi:hypothetical protein
MVLNLWRKKHPIAKRQRRRRLLRSTILQRYFFPIVFDAL